MTAAGAVLAGGHSRRMGRPKALIPVDGRAMADRALDAMRSAGVGPVVVVGGEHTGLSAPVVPDDFPGEGPVGGIISAMRHFGAVSNDVQFGDVEFGDVERVVIVSCDMPLLDADVLTQLLSAHHGHTVAVAATSERREPLCAVWSRSLLADVEAIFSAGERAVHRVVDRVASMSVPVDGRTLLNVNTPRDLEAAVGSSVVPIEEITVDELQALGSDVCLLDVREDHEWDDAHIAHAVHVPLGTVPDRLGAFVGSPTYVICKVGGRSMHACEVAAAQGHHVVNVAGGMLAWLAAGYETA